MNRCGHIQAPSALARMAVEKAIQPKGAPPPGRVRYCGAFCAMRSNMEPTPPYICRGTARPTTQAMTIMSRPWKKLVQPMPRMPLV